MGHPAIGKRARRAIIASQRTRPFGCAQGRLLARLAQIPRCAKERLPGMTIKLGHYPAQAKLEQGTLKSLEV